MAYENPTLVYSDVVQQVPCSRCYADANSMNLTRSLATDVCLEHVVVPEDRRGH